MLRNVHQNKVLTLKEFDPYQKILDILGVRRNCTLSMMDPTINLMNKFIINIRE